MHRLQKLSFLTILTILTLILTRCASEARLTGGPKDTQAPSILQSSPKNKQTHFQSKKVIIYFDEYIKLKGLQKELILSPPIDPKPEIEVKGKSLLINIDADLLDSTTYTIYMGNAITDITEGNAIPNFKYIFSTGDYVDSLAIEGNVIDAFNSKPMEDILVMLYKKIKHDSIVIDSIPLIRKPMYLSKTNKEGNYHIENIAEGEYLLFALKDENRNYLYDLPSEMIAFSDSLLTFNYQLQTDTSYTVLPADSTGHIDSTQLITMRTISKKLRLFQEKDSIQKFLSAQLSAENKIEIAYKIPLYSPELKLIGDSLPSKYYSQINKTKDSLFVWFSPYEKDSLSIVISDKTIGTDSLDIKVVPSKKQIGKSLSINSNINKQGLRPDTNFVLTFNYPIDSIDTKRVIFLEDSLNLPYSYIFLDTNRMKLSFDNTFSEEKKYELILMDSALYDIRGMTNDSLKIIFTKKPEDDYGQFTLNILDSIGGQKIIDLMQKEKIIERKIIAKSSQITYPLLPPGEYRIRCIFDNNKNGKWDVGNYSKKIQAEEIQFFDKKIKVRASWEMKEKWSFE